MRALVEELRRLLREYRPIPIDKAQAKRFAERAAEALQKQLSHGTWAPSRPLSQKPTWTFPLGRYNIVDVTGRPASAEVELSMKEPKVKYGPRRWVAGGSLATWGEHTGKTKRVLTISLRASKTPAELLGHLSEVEEEIFSVLLHEVTHLADVLGGSTSGLPTAQYHNDPSEIKAFLQQITHEVLTYIHELGKDGGGWLFTGPPSSDFLHTALDHSPTWEHIHRDLKPDNEKRIFHSISRSVSAEWPKLRKLYPDEDED